MAISAVLVGFIWAVTACVKAINTQAVSVFSLESMRIVVDAGHGGIDSGVSGTSTGVKESDLNLLIATALKSELEEAGFEVTLTRKTQAGLYGTTAKGFKKRDMQKRKQIIEENKPAMLISIHQNSYPSKSERGGQVFYLKENERGRYLANVLQARLNGLYGEEGVRARKANGAEYFMLKCAPCPSVVVECGFLSSPRDEKLLCSPAWRKDLVEDLTAGVIDFYQGQSL